VLSLCPINLFAMLDTFKNLTELLQYFKDEATCREYLAQKRWGGKPTCPYCKHDKVYNIENGKRYKCANPKCYKKFSVTVNSIFEDTNISLQKWFTAIYLCTSHKKGISSIQLAKDIGVSQKTAWHLEHRIREMLKVKEPIVLKGTVEADETYVGGKESNKHKHKRVTKAGTAGKIAMLGLVERGGKVYAQRIVSPSKEFIAPVLTKYIEFGSNLHTDEWSAYTEVGEKHYKHATVKHKLKIYVDGDVTTNTIEGFWAILKRGLYGIYHYASAKHIDRYLDEFCARYNTRKLGEVERFDHFLEKCSDTTLTWDRLVNTPLQLY